MYKLLLSDLDGTLRGHDTDVSPAFKQIARQVMQQGTLFTLATGRVFPLALPFAEELEVNAPLVCVNGALIIDACTRREIYKRLIPTPIIETAMRFAREQGLRFSTYLDDYHTVLEQERGTGRFWEWVDGERKSTVSDPLPYLERGALNCLVWTESEEMTRRVIPSFQAWMGDSMHVTRSLPNLAEAILPDVSKARAAAILAEHLGVSREQVMALGDSDNDVEMLTWAGLGVAVGSGTPAARAAADCVVGPVDQDGAADAVRRFILRAESATPGTPRQ